MADSLLSYYHKKSNPRKDCLGEQILVLRFGKINDSEDDSGVLESQAPSKTT